MKSTHFTNFRNGMLAYIEQFISVVTPQPVNIRDDRIIRVLFKYPGQVISANK